MSRKSEQFIAWLEGYLDACKNKLTAANVRVIRKKIKSINVDSTIIGSVTPINAIYTNSSQLNDSIDEDFINAVETNKNKTLDEIS